MGPGNHENIRHFTINYRYEETISTLVDRTFYNFEKNTGCLNHGFLGLFVALEWQKGIMECTFTFTLAQRRCQRN
jgi:hypothetical protein